MLGFFLPAFEGELEVPVSEDSALAAIADSLRGGRFSPKSRYRIVEEAPDRLLFQSRGWRTALDGHNMVLVEACGSGRLHYNVTFRSWFYLVLAFFWGLGTLRLAFHAAALFSITGSLEMWEVRWLLFGPLTNLSYLIYPFLLPPLFRLLFQRTFVKRIRVTLLTSFGEGLSDNERLMLQAARRTYKSPRMVCGFPLVHVAFGPQDPLDDDVFGRAKGVIAIGDIAVGVVAIGGVAKGVVAIGGISAGLLAVGGFAFGGLAAGVISVGLVAVGGLAVGGIAFGVISDSTWAAGDITLPNAQ